MGRVLQIENEPTIGWHVAPFNLSEDVPLVNMRLVQIFYLVRNHTFHLSASSTFIPSTCHHMVWPHGTCTSVPHVTLPVVTRVELWLVHVNYMEPTVSLPHVMLPCQHDDVNVDYFNYWPIWLFACLAKHSESENSLIWHPFEKVDICRE